MGTAVSGSATVARLQHDPLSRFLGGQAMPAVDLHTHLRHVPRHREPRRGAPPAGPALAAPSLLARPVNRGEQPTSRGVTAHRAPDCGQVGGLATDAKQAALAVTALFSRLDRESLLDPSKASGETLAVVKGEIELREVVFAYPTRLDFTVRRAVFRCHNR